MGALGEHLCTLPYQCAALMEIQLSGHDRSVDPLSPSSRPRLAYSFHSSTWRKSPQNRVESASPPLLSRIIAPPDHRPIGLRSDAIFR